jgi:hypothetical protein
LREHLGDLVDPSTRALVWITLIQLVDRGRLAPSELTDLVVRWLGEADPETALTAVLAHTTLAADLWVPADQRERLLGRLADWACGSAHQAPAGSDRQVALARAATRCAIRPERPEAWLAGRDLPPGLAVDADLRWRLIERLASLGAADQGLMDAEVGRDPSSSGQLHARRAAAAMPSVTGKETAWRAAAAGDLSNHELTATGQGFWQAGQAELLAPYLARFAEDLPRVCDRQTPQMVKLFVHSFFPRSRVAESTLSMAEGLLASDLTPGARRAVADARDDVQRGLTALSAESRPRSGHIRPKVRLNGPAQATFVQRCKSGGLLGGAQAHRPVDDRAAVSQVYPVHTGVDQRGPVLAQPGLGVRLGGEGRHLHGARLEVSAVRVDAPPGPVLAHVLNPTRCQPSPRPGGRAR